MFGDSAQRATAALMYLVPPTDRGEWLRLMMAAKAGGVTEDDACAWSARGANFDQHAFRSAWRSIKPGGITERTLFYEARQSGWNQDDASFSAGSSKVIRSRAAYLEKMRRADEEKAARQVLVAKYAQEVWDSALPASDAHPYLVRKNVPSYGLRTFRWEAFDRSARELVGIDNTLIVPICDAQSKVHSLQFIFPCANPILGRDRDFLRGGAKKGNFFMIGQPRIVNGRPMIIVAEGYATAASIHRSTGEAVVVAFDKGNLEPVARAIRVAFENPDITIFADRDHADLSKCGGTKAALKAAVAVHGRIYVPEHCGMDGRDANDIEQLGSPDRPGVSGRELLREYVSRALPRSTPQFDELWALVDPDARDEYLMLF